MKGRAETECELRITPSDIMINYYLSQKLKLLGNDAFKHLTIILTIIIISFVYIWFSYILVRLSMQCFFIWYNVILLVMYCNCITLNSLIHWCFI
jgi:hypothetical protein